MTRLERAQVLQRWNGWVQVYLPDAQETRWINLTAAYWEPEEGPEDELSSGRVSNQEQSALWSAGVEGHSQVQ